MCRFINFLHCNSGLKMDKAKYLNLLQLHLCDFNRTSMIIGVMAVIVCQTDYEQIFTMETFIYTCISYLIPRIVDIEESDYRLGVWLVNKSKGLDYGTCLAQSIFFGYLKIILPHKGDENKGICELLELYENMHNINIPVKKLFILIPANLYCPPDLSKIMEGKDVYLQSSATCEHIERDVCGQKSRIYKNSVYKICNKDCSPPIYVVAEGAVPLLRMHETIQQISKYRRQYETLKHDIVFKFYLVLKELIDNDAECKNLCEPIYYDDTDEEINIAKLLLQKVNESLEQSEIRNSYL